MYAMPLFGLIVVNGLDDISAGANVAALKKVDFPAFGFPTKPINIYFNPNLAIVL